MNHATKIFSLITLIFSFSIASADIASTPEISAPISGSSFSSDTVTFTLDHNTLNITRSILWAGSVSGSFDYDARMTRGNTITLDNLPTDGSTVYVRLYSYISPNQGSPYRTVTNYTYTASSTPVIQPTIATPAPGTTLPSTENTIFTFNNNGLNITKWILLAGSAPNIADYDARFTTRNRISIRNLPNNGSPVYMRLYYKVGNGTRWVKGNDFTYTATDQSACVTRAQLVNKIRNSQDVTQVNTNCITDMSRLFAGYPQFNQDISAWDTSNVTNMSRMFQGNKFFNQDLSSWNISKVTNMSSMFLNSWVNTNNSSWNTSNVNNMSVMFYNAEVSSDISSWDVSNVVDMRLMFACDNVDPADVCGIFNQPIGVWDVSSVRNMESMFSGAETFNQDISSWNVSNVSDMNFMFIGASAFTNHDLSNWDISSVGFCKGTDFLDGTGPGNTEPNFMDYQACFGK